MLVAKALTKSDTGGRVILPRVSVESNLRFLIGFRRVAAALELPWQLWGFTNTAHGIRTSEQLMAPAHFGRLVGCCRRKHMTLQVVLASGIY